MNPFSVAEAFLSGTVGGTSYPSIDVRIGSQGIADDRRHVDLMNWGWSEESSTFCWGYRLITYSLSHIADYTWYVAKLHCATIHGNSWAVCFPFHHCHHPRQVVWMARWSFSTFTACRKQRHRVQLCSSLLLWVPHESKFDVKRLLHQFLLYVSPCQPILHVEYIV